MSNVTIISAMTDSAKEDYDFVDLCSNAGIEKKTAPELPVVSGLDYTEFEEENNRNPWLKWNLLDDAIRRLMYSLHDQFRQNVEAKKSDNNINMVIAKKGSGTYGEEKVYSLDEYTNLYTLVFELVSNERLGRSSRALFSRYQKRCSFFAKHHVRMTTESVADGENLLKVLVATSKNFSTFLEIMNQIFMALDSSRTYSIHDTRPTIETHGKQEYYNEIFDTSKNNLKFRIIDSLLEVYRNLRYKPSETDITVYTDVIGEVFEKISNCYDVFGKDYQEHLIRDIRNYYMSLGNFWRIGQPIDDKYRKYFPAFAGNGKVDLAQYANLCEKSFAIEMELQSKLHTRAPLKKKIDMELRSTLIDAAVGPESLFNRQNFDELFSANDFRVVQRLFTMFSSNSQAVQIVSESLKSYIITQGEEIIKKYQLEYEAFREEKVKILFKGNLSENNKRVLDNAIKNKTQVIKDIIAKSIEHEHLVDEIFDKSFDMVKAYRSAYSKIASMKVDGNAQEELLPVYVNRIINRLEQKTDQECENALSDLSHYFHFLQSKDEFMVTHRDLLAKRILSYEAKPNCHLEQYFLQRLSTKEGVQFTTQAEKQLQDCIEKTDHNRKYASWAATQPSLRGLPEFEVQVIAAKAWPVEQNLALFNNCKLPEPLERLNASFDEYYRSTTKKRKIEWLHRSSIATTLFAPTADSDKTYRVIANAQQVAILSQFTDYDVKLSQEELQLRSGIVRAEGSTQSDIDHFNKVLRSCMGIKMKLLNKDPDSDCIMINSSFKSNERTVKLPEPYVNVEVDKAEIGEDRSLSIQFAIVKAMKLRKNMKYTDLINETMDQLKHFKPQLRAVKEALDEIISKDWVRRNPDDASMLVYVA